jgi:hypothetical protein
MPALSERNTLHVGPFRVVSEGLDHQRRQALVDFDDEVVYAQF